MGNAKEDISVRISADFDKALKDVLRFTGSAERGFEELPKAVQQVATSVDKLSDRIEKMGQSDGPDRLKRKLGEVNQEASRFRKTLDGLVTGGKALGGVMAGWQAGKMVLAPQVEAMMKFDNRLADLSNLANDKLDAAGRIAAIPDLNAKIMQSIQGNGGDRSAGLEAFQRILGAGPFSKEQAEEMVPVVMRGATASGAPAEQISDIGIAAVQNMKFSSKDLEKIIGMSIKSGNLGGFELNKMAQYLPGHMGVASETLGLKGDRGYAQLLTLNQAAMLTEKNPDRAANNVANLLNKMTSADTLKDFSKQGFDLTKIMQGAVEKGGNPFLAFEGTVQKIMSGNKEYQALEKKLGKTKDGSEQQAILEQQRVLLQGAGIGTVLQDMQARLAYFGLKKMGSTEFERQTGKVITDPRTALNTNFDTKKSRLEFSNQQRINAEQDAQAQALSTLTPALKSYSDWMVKLGNTSPLLLATIEGGKSAFTTIGAASGAASVVMLLLSKNATAASAALARVAVSGAAGGVDLPGKGKGGKLLTALGAAGRLVAPVALPAAAAYGLYEWKNSENGKASRARGLSLENQRLQMRINEAKANGDTELQTRLEKQRDRQAMQIAGLRGPDAVARAVNGADPDRVGQALKDSMKSNPIEAKLQLKILFDEMGKPVVSDTKLSGTNFRLDTGPMMTN